MTTNYYRIQWKQTTEKMRGFFIILIIVQLFFSLNSIAGQFGGTVVYAIFNANTTFLVTLLAICFGAIKVAQIEPTDVFRLPLSVKIRVDSLMLMLLALYGSVTALLIPYVAYGGKYSDAATYYDTTLLTSGYFYKNMLICFLLILAASMWSYTVRLLKQSKQWMWVSIYMVTIILCVVAYIYSIGHLFTSWQWLGFSAMLLVVEFGFLQWRFKGVMAK